MRVREKADLQAASVLEEVCTRPQDVQGGRGRLEEEEDGFLSEAIF